MEGKLVCVVPLSQKRAGVSMSGDVALGFALQAPERVERLALIDSALKFKISQGNTTFDFARQSVFFH